MRKSLLDQAIDYAVTHPEVLVEIGVVIFAVMPPKAQQFIMRELTRPDSYQKYGPRSNTAGG